MVQQSFKVLLTDHSDMIFPSHLKIRRYFIAGQSRDNYGPELNMTVTCLIKLLPNQLGPLHELGQFVILVEKPYRAFYHSDVAGRRDCNYVGSPLELGNPPIVGHGESQNVPVRINRAILC